MSWRRFGIVVQNLPASSVYWTAVRNATDPDALPEPSSRNFGPWELRDFLLAGIFDRIGDLIYMQSDKSQPPPKKYPRPYLRDSNVTPISAEALAYLEYKREHHGEDPPEDWEPEVG
jgi:hypothetical protein